MVYVSINLKFKHTAQIKYTTWGLYELSIDFRCVRYAAVMTLKEKWFIPPFRFLELWVKLGA